MPRRNRPNTQNTWLHIFNRGNARKSIFCSNYLKETFIDLLHVACREYNIEVHSYCVMTNHYHLLVYDKDGNASKAMWFIGSKLARIINQEINSDGPVFKSRYGTLVIDHTRYLLQVSRYIHQNPVDSGLSKDAWSYKWSSAQFFLPHSFRCPSFLTTDYLKQFFVDSNEYQEFIDLGIDHKTARFYSKRRFPCTLNKKTWDEN